MSFDSRPSTTATYRRRAIVASEIGLHARPAAIIARAAQQAQAPVYLQFGSETVEATSGLMIMTLGAECGDEVTVESSDQAAVERVAELIQTQMRPL